MQSKVDINLLNGYCLHDSIFLCFIIQLCVCVWSAELAGHCVAYAKNSHQHPDNIRWLIFFHMLQRKISPAFLLFVQFIFARICAKKSITHRAGRANHLSVIQFHSFIIILSKLQRRSKRNRQNRDLQRKRDTVSSNELCVLSVICIRLSPQRHIGFSLNK